MALRTLCMQPHMFTVWLPFRAQGAVPTAGSVVWRAAPRCIAPPTKYSSSIDNRGRLWGWEHETSCAFKTEEGDTLYDWATAPRCAGGEGALQLLRQRMHLLRLAGLGMGTITLVGHWLSVEGVMLAGRRPT